MKLTDLNLSSENTKVVPSKTNRSYTFGAELKSSGYQRYRAKQKLSGFHVGGGWELAVDRATILLVLSLHGFTPESAELSAKAFADSVYGDNYGRIERIGTLIVPNATDTRETLVEKYLERANFGEVKETGDGRWIAARRENGKLIWGEGAYATRQLANHEAMGNACA